MLYMKQITAIKASGFNSRSVPLLFENKYVNMKMCPKNNWCGSHMTFPCFVLQQKNFLMSAVNSIYTLKHMRCIEGIICTCVYCPQFLLSSIFSLKKKYWNRENFRLLVFDGFLHFEMS